MHELAVVGNPRRKRDSKGRFLKRGKRSSGKRRSRRSSSASPASTKRRRRRSTSSSAPRRRRRARTAIVTVRRYRRNPRGLSVKGLMGLVTDALMPSAIAAGGALGTDLALAYVPIPERFKTGPVRHATRAIASILLGVGASFVLKPAHAAQILSGGLTVTFHQAARDAMARALPNVRLASADDDGVSAFEQEVAELLESERSMGALTFEPGPQLAAFDNPFASPMAAVDEEA